jgi:predicted nucleotidyltransferase
MKEADIFEKITSVIKSHTEIKLAYLFGSHAADNAGPLSDYDFAFYIDGKDEKSLCDLKFVLMDKIGRALQTDRIDVVILNLTESPELKYSIIKEGKLIHAEEPFKVLIEPRILNEYFDFHDLLVRNKLTKAI